LHPSASAIKSSNIKAREKRIIVHDCFWSSLLSPVRELAQEPAAHHRFAKLLEAKEGSGRRVVAVWRRSKRIVQHRSEKEMFARRQSRSLLVVVLDHPRWMALGRKPFSKEYDSG